MQLETIGRYRILKEIGRGAMGRVWLAHDPEIDRSVAIKTVQIFSSLPEAEQREARERFVREARSAGKLLHPGIVTIFDVGEAGGVPYLAMEYVEGTTLDAYCRPESLLPLETVIEICVQAAEALDFAHRLGVVHRDIKPSNLMRVGEASVKIMDFGLAKRPEAQLTHDGKLLGTPNYMSPEQIRGDPLDGRSDLFSLAVVLFELTVGERPFGGDTVSSVLYRIVHDDPSDPAAARPGVPPALAEFLRHALAKLPGDRPQTGREFAQELRRAIEGAPAGTAKSEASYGVPASERAHALGTAAPERVGAASEASATPGRRWRALWIAGGAVVVAAALSLAYLASASRLAQVPPEAAVWLDATVRTEPPGLPVTLDGKPLTTGHVRFSSAGPLGILAAKEKCRTASHRLDPRDGGGEIVLVTDPVSVELLLDPGVPGARVRVNRSDAGPAPARVSVDLCRENELEATAPGFRDARIVLPTGTSPVEARTAVAGLRLTAIPKGSLRFPETAFPVRFFVDGKPVAAARGGVDLAEGHHEVRAVDAEHWIDVATTATVTAGETVDADLAIPELGTLVVQAFPSNCRVYLRRPGRDWRYLDDTPVRREIAVGRYGLRVEYAATGATKEQNVTIVAGANPPLRFAFGAGESR